MMMQVTNESAPDAAEAAERMRAFCGPDAVDQHIRQAISTCWMMLPEGEKTVEALEREVRRLVERALANLKEDAAAFGIGRAAGQTAKNRSGRRRR